MMEREDYYKLRKEIKTIFNNRKHIDTYDFEEQETTIRCILDVIFKYVELEKE